MEKGKKILVVDDEESILLLYREELEEEGYEVFSAMDGEEALKIFERVPIDLVVLDINMPGMDGIGVLRQLKARKPTLPVILSTAYAEYKHDIGAWASDDYIVKSSNMDELKNSIRKHLE